jgi:hypothetical protein
MHSATSALRVIRAGANRSVHRATRPSEELPLPPFPDGHEQPLPRFGDGGSSLLPLRDGHGPPLARLGDGRPRFTRYVTGTASRYPVW